MILFFVCYCVSVALFQCIGCYGGSVALFQYIGCHDGSVPLFQYVGSPVGYVQQVVVKSVVSPWQPQQMIPADAFRAPLAKVFDVLHQLENFQQQTRSELAVCHFHSHLGHADCQLCFYIIEIFLAEVFYKLPIY